MAIATNYGTKLPYTGLKEYSLLLTQQIVNQFPITTLKETEAGGGEPSLFIPPYYITSLLSFQVFKTKKPSYGRCLNPLVIVL